MATAPGSRHARPLAWFPSLVLTAVLLGPAVAQASSPPLTLLDCQARLYQGRPALALSFSAPLEPTQPQAAFGQVQALGALPPPPDGNATPGAEPPAAPAAAGPGTPLPATWVLDANPRTLWFTEIKPAWRYRVQLNPALQAAAGGTLAGATHCTVDSPAMPASLAFASNGVVLPAGQNGGLPIVTVNVPEVDVEFLRVQPERLPDFYDKVLGYGLSADSADDRWRYRANRRLQGEVSNWDLDALNGLATSVFQGRFQTRAEPDLRATTFLPIESLPELQQPGIYLAVMRQPGRFPYEHQVTYFYVSDLGLHVHQHPRQTTVFVTSLREATAVPDVTLSLLDARGQVLARASSDAMGQAIFEGAWPNARVLVAARGAEQSTLALRQPALDLSEFPVTGLPGGEPRLFVWAGRQLYRPGESFTVSVLQRDADGKPVPAAPVHARWKQADGRVVREAQWAPSPQAPGYFQASFDIPASATTGTWSLELRHDPSADTPDATWSFAVEDFLPERLQLTLTPSSTVLAHADAWSLAAEGSWRFGGSAGGQTLQTTLRREPANAWLPGWPGFRFGNLADAAEPEWQELPEQTLNDQGQAHIGMAASQLASADPSRWVATVRLLDPGGRPVIRQAQAQWWPAPVLLGLRPEFADDTATAGAPASFDVIRADAQGQLHAASVTVRLFREHREFHWRYDDQSGWTSGYLDQDELLETLTLALPQGRNRLTLPVGWGRYRLELHDPDTGEVLPYRFFAGWDAAATEALGNRPDRVSVQVQPLPIGGDTQRLRARITPPHAGQAVVTLETDRVLWSTRLAVHPDGTDLDIPWPAQLNRHDAYLGVVVFRAAADGTGPQATPSRAVGLAYLPLQRHDRELDVQLTAPATAQPGTTLTLQLALEPSGAGGAELPAEDTWLTLSLVDTGILDLDPRPAPDPAAWFFGQQRYGGAWRDLYGRLIERLPGTPARLRWGGDAAPGLRPDLAIPVQMIDEFHGPVRFDAKGRLTLPITLPDFQGELALRATVFSASHYGSAQGRVVVAAPWVAEWATPRFLRTGDHSEFVLGWHHLSGPADTLHWNLTAGGPLQPGVTAGQLTLAPGQRQAAAVAVQAGPTPAMATLQLVAQTPNTPATPESLQLNRELTLPVLPAQAPQQQTRWLRLDPGATLALPTAPPAGWQAEGYQVALLAQPAPQLGWAVWAQPLLDYPWHCAEQTVSSAYPWLWLDAAQVAALAPPTDPAFQRPARDAALLTAVARLAALQTPGGGFALWAGGSADPWVSAWVTGFLQQLGAQGGSVPTELQRSSQTALLAQLRAAPAALMELPSPAVTANTPAASGDADATWVNEAHGRFAAAALAGVVLAQRQQAPLATLRQLWEQHASRARSPLPLLHLASALHAMGDTARAQAAVQAAARQPYAVGWRNAGTTDYGSPLRDLAWSYAIALRQNWLPEQRENWLQQVLAELAQRPVSGLTTQEWQALLQAGLAQPAPEHTGQHWQLHLGNLAPLTPEAPNAELNPARLQRNAAQSLRHQGTSPVWVQITQRGYATPLTSSPDAAELGLQVQRRWFHPDGRPWQGEALTPGSALVVRLDVRSDQPLPNALVTDPLPAGFALDNLNLLPENALPDSSYDGVSWAMALGDGRVRHREYRLDRYGAALDIDGEVSLLYRVQVLNAGQYQVPQALVQAMYVPELQAVSAPAAALRVGPRPTPAP